MIPSAVAVPKGHPVDSPSDADRLHVSTPDGASFEVSPPEGGWLDLNVGDLVRKVILECNGLDPNARYTSYANDCISRPTDVDCSDPDHLQLVNAETPPFERSREVDTDVCLKDVVGAGTRHIKIVGNLEVEGPNGKRLTFFFSSDNMNVTVAGLTAAALRHWGIKDRDGYRAFGYPSVPATADGITQPISSNNPVRLGTDLTLSQAWTFSGRRLFITREFMIARLLF